MTRSGLNDKWSHCDTVIDKMENIVDDDERLCLLHNPLGLRTSELHDSHA